jgi:hypothetical protein
MRKFKAISHLRCSLESPFWAHLRWSCPLADPVTGNSGNKRCSQFDMLTETKRGTHELSSATQFWRTIAKPVGPL